MNKTSLIAIAIFSLLAAVLVGCNQPQKANTSPTGTAANKPSTAANSAKPIAAQKGTPKLMELGANT